MWHDRRMLDPQLSNGTTRRSLLGAAIAAPFAATCEPFWRADFKTPNLRKPDILRFVAGIRPSRRSGVRIERERLGDKAVVHNYGHGGSGVTMSWGSAEEAVQLVTERHEPPLEVAVLGCGAIGLATARVLQEKGYRVSIYAKDFPPHTTSNLAGAVWHPGGPLRQASRAQLPRIKRILKRSWARFRGLAKQGGHGVSWRDRYEHYSVPRIRKADDMPIEWRRIERLPFAGGDRVGQKASTFLIEPPIYLAELQRQVLLAGARLQRRVFASAADVTKLSQPVIIDCLGLGAREVFADEKLYPVRGQLVHLFPERLPYLLSGSHGYLFPRSDAIVLGGTFEEGIADTKPDRRMCERILARHRRFFGL